MDRTVTTVTATDPAVRVLTLNLDSNRLTIADRLPVAAAAIRALDPDVVCLQEVAQFDDAPSAAHQLAEAVGMPVVADAVHDIHPRGYYDSVAILSRLESRGAFTRELTDAPEYLRRAAAAELVAPSGRSLIVATAHLAWGQLAEPQRLAEAAIIDSWVGQLTAGDPAKVAVFTGDFNALPASATVRWLTGLDVYNGQGAYWVDAWAKVGEGPGITSSATNPWVAHTAARVGIARAEMNPDRRIDFVMVRGWAHGRPGCPLEARVVCDEPAAESGLVPSDHYGLLVHLWDPPL